MAHDAGEGLSVTPQTLRKRLKEKGLLVSVDHKRETLTVRRRLGGSSKEVLHLSRSIVLPESWDDEVGECRVKRQDFVGLNVGKSREPDKDRSL
jgi:hypothetical protein